MGLFYPVKLEVYLDRPDYTIEEIASICGAYPYFHRVCQFNFDCKGPYDAQLILNRLGKITYQSRIYIGQEIVVK